LAIGCVGDSGVKTFPSQQLRSLHIEVRELFARDLLAESMFGEKTS